MSGAAKWMKRTANLCTTATVLIATVIFAAAKQYLEGSVDNGRPMLGSETAFNIFGIADTLILSNTLHQLSLIWKFGTLQTCNGCIFFWLNEVKLSADFLKKMVEQNQLLSSAHTEDATTNLQSVSAYSNLQRLESGVYILTFTGEPQHRFTPEAICSINDSLDQEYLLTLQQLISKMLTFCIPTIAIIRGHAVRTGCLFALAHDYRIMSSTHDYIFMNEVNIGMSLTPGNMAVLCSKLPKLTFSEVVLTGYNSHTKPVLWTGKNV